MTELVVELYGRRVGVLYETRNTFDFRADVDAIEHYGFASPILSYAVPLVTRPRSTDAALRRNFFDELLPEGRARMRLAGNAKLAPDYTIGMLARYGRDVAGAVKIWDPTAAGEPRSPRTENIDAAGIRRLLAEVRNAPIGNTSVRRMSSLAGIQDKIVLARVGESWAEPIDGYPSTHIVKPIVGTHPTLIFDEEYGARIARLIGLSSHETYIEQFDGVSALVIERYDRDNNAPDGRIHQEDFNQAMGMSGDAKYEESGHPGLRAIARLLRERVDRQAVEQLLRLTTMSIAVGNLDMHAKNISVLHLPDGTAALAPAYDVVPQTHQPFDQEFAFSVNGTQNHADIGFRDLVAEGESWGIRDAELIVESTVTAVRETIDHERPVAGAHHALTQDIERITERLLATRGEVPRPRIAHPRKPKSRELPTNPGGWGGPVSR